MNLDPSLTGDTRVKSVIYINNQLPSHSFSPISTNSPLIAGVTLALPSPHPPLHLLSAYIPPSQAQEMSHVKPILGNLRPNPILLEMDSNLHHTLWNLINYQHTHHEAEDLVTLMNKAGLMLRLEAGVPTSISNHARTGETMVDLQWASPECYDWATVCKIDTSSEQSHFSDHLAIVTELDLPSNPLLQVQPKSKPNWSKTNWELYQTTLSANLLPILRACAQPEQPDIDEFLANITLAIEQAIEALTPSLTIKQKSRRWWSTETLNPLKHQANYL